MNVGKHLRAHRLSIPLTLPLKQGYNFNSFTTDNLEPQRGLFFSRRPDRPWNCSMLPDLTFVVNSPRTITTISQSHSDQEETSSLYDFRVLPVVVQETCGAEDQAL